MAGIPHAIFNRDRTLGLLMKVSPKRISDPQVSSRVIASHKWAIEALGQIMDGKFVCPAVSTTPVHRGPGVPLVPSKGFDGVVI